MNFFIYFRKWREFIFRLTLNQCLKILDQSLTQSNDGITRLMIGSEGPRSDRKILFNFSFVIFFQNFY